MAKHFPNKSHTKFRGAYVTSGERIGAKTKSVYICGKCRVWHRKKPAFYCEMNGCDSTQFEFMASTSEAIRYAELLLLESRDLIARLETQVSFALNVVDHTGSKETKIGNLILDFTYEKDGKLIYEDVKGSAITALAAWKIKHAEAQYGIDIKLLKK